MGPQELTIKTVAQEREENPGRKPAAAICPAMKEQESNKSSGELVWSGIGSAIDPRRRASFWIPGGRRGGLELSQLIQYKVGLGGHPG